MQRTKRAWNRRLTLWTLAFTLGGALGIAEELQHASAPVTVSAASAQLDR